VSIKLTKQTIIDKINSQIGLSKLQSKKVTNLFFNTIIQGMHEDGVVKIANFGTFKVLNKKKQALYNINTKKRTILEARKAVSFKLSKSLKDKIGNGTKNEHLKVSNNK
jgi:nucleoid DNA-binding protein